MSLSWLRRMAVVLTAGLYLFLLAGLASHTAIHGDVLGKYSLLQAVALLAGAVLFVPFVKLTGFVLKESVVTRRSGRQVRITVPIKIILSLVFLACCLMPVEMTLRANRSAKIRYALHPFLQNDLSPEDPSHLNINSHGFRGDEISVVKPPGTFRIFLLGGSTVLSKEMVDFEQTHARILQKLLEKQYPGVRIEVQNAGNQWHTTEHSAIKYLFKIKDYSPDMIIMWHGISDLYRSFSPPRFAFGEYKSDYGHFYGPLSYAGLNPAKQAPVFSINLFPLIRRYGGDALFSDFRPLGGKAVHVTDFPSLAAFGRNMRSLLNILRDDGVQVVFATEPSLYSTELGQADKRAIWFPKTYCINKQGEYPDMDSMIAGMKAFNDETRRVAAETGVPLLDLDSAVPRNGTYLLDDCHLSASGNELVGKKLFEFLVANRLVPGTKQRDNHGLH